MAVDCHTHVGVAGTHVGDPLRRESIRAFGVFRWDVELETHREASSQSAHTVVLAFDAPPVGVVVPNEYVGLRVGG